MGKRLYVGNLSQNTDQATLKQAFAAQGTVEMLRILTDKGISRGFGFVEMSNEREATQAIKNLNGTELDGNTIVVDEATPPSSNNSRNDGPRPGGRRFGGPRR